MPRRKTPPTAADIRGIILKSPDAQPGEQLSNSPPASLPNFLKYREALHDAWGELDSQHDDTDGWHDLAAAVCDETGIQPRVLDNTTPADEVKYVRAAVRRKVRKGSTAVRRSHPLSAEDWNKLQDDERVEYSPEMSPNELAKLFCYSWPVIKKDILSGKIRAVMFTSKRYRIRQADLPKTT